MQNLIRNVKNTYEKITEYFLSILHQTPKTKVQVYFYRVPGGEIKIGESDGMLDLSSYTHPDQIQKLGHGEVNLK